MIAKLIAFGPDRSAALSRLSRALTAYEVVGPHTNIGLLRAIVDHPAFRAAELDTGFIRDHGADLFPLPSPAPRAVLAAAVAEALADATNVRADPADPHSPWAAASAWRLNGDGYQDVHLDEAGSAHVLRAHLAADGTFRLDLPDGPAQVMVGTAADGRRTVTLDGTTLAMRVHRAGDAITVFHPAGMRTLTLVDPRAPSGAASCGAGRVLAPMPGRVLDVLVAPGDAVARGAVLLVLEAMKVQMRITAPGDGTVTAVQARPGDLVDDGMELVTISAPP